MMVLAGGRLPPADNDSKWRYPQGTVILRADDKESLRKIVFEYRLRNHIPIGNIEQDISDFYCKRWPKFCTPDTSDRRGLGEPWLNRITNWASEMAHTAPKGGWPLVTSAEADRRAAICSSCPKQTAWRGGCGGCSQSTLNVLQTLKQMHRTKRDGNLNACSVGVWENTVAVHLEVAAIPVNQGQRDQMPDACWRKELP